MNTRTITDAEYGDIEDLTAQVARSRAEQFPLLNRERRLNDLLFHIDEAAEEGKRSLDLFQMKYAFSNTYFEQITPYDFVEMLELEKRGFSVKPIEKTWHEFMFFFKHTETFHTVSW